MTAVGSEGTTRTTCIVDARPWSGWKNSKRKWRTCERFAPSRREFARDDLVREATGASARPMRRIRPPEASAALATRRV